MSNAKLEVSQQLLLLFRPEGGHASRGTCCCAYSIQLLLTKPSQRSLLLCLAMQDMVTWTSTLCLLTCLLVTFYVAAAACSCLKHCVPEQELPVEV